MATKKALSQHSVRQSTFAVSAKTSDILQLFLNPPITDTLGHDWSTGLIYFRGFAEPDISATDSTQDIIGFCPAWLLTCQATTQGGSVTLYRRSDNGRTHTRQKSQNDFSNQLKCLYATLQHDLADTDIAVQSSSPHAFRGGLAGFIGYDPEAQARLQGDHFAAEASSLSAAMGHYDVFLKKEDHHWALYGPTDPTLSTIYSEINSYLTRAFSQSPATLDRSQQQLDAFQVIQPFKNVWQAEDYRRAFMGIQQYLADGDCYQVNLTQPFVAEVSGNLLDTLDALMTLTQAPYSGYMRVGQHEILSCSPELFLAFSGTAANTLKNQVLTRPIKGTFPRSSDPVLDLAYKERLTHSEKDHSENLMIVDLLRNDLSKHAETGSVQVPVLFAVESFAQVHHLVSEIRATLNRDATPLDVLLAALPGGSITGAPKKRAMEIIEELEAAPRGAYCGSMGYLNHDGSGQFNILIRTLQQHGSHLVAWAGGGITAASQLDAEYQECFDKIKAILDCVNQFHGSPS